MVEELIKSAELSDLFVESCPEAYIIGAQDGAFPPVGNHIEGKMGGVWVSGGRAIDAISHRIGGVEPGPADRFSRRPSSSSCHWTESVKGVTVVREQTARGCAAFFEYRTEFQDEAGDDLEFELEVKFEIIPEWTGEVGEKKSGRVRIKPTSSRNIRATNERIGLAIDFATSIPFHSYSTLSGDRSSDGASSLIAVLRYPLSLLQDRDLKVVIKNAEKGEMADLLTSGTQDTPEDSSGEERRGVFSDYTRLRTNDRKLDRSFNWSKLNCEELRRNFSESSGSPVCGGYPEFPWLFGIDSSFIIPVFLRTGQFEAAKDTLLALFDCDGRGFAPHEVTTNGKTVNEANANELAIIPRLLLEYYRYTGDEETTRSLYDQLKTTMREYVSVTSRVPFPEGFGIVEMPAMDQWMLDTAVEFIRCGKSLLRLARLFEDQVTLNNFRDGFLTRLTRKFFDLFWDEDSGRFVDMVGKEARLEEGLGSLIGDNSSSTQGGITSAKSLKNHLDTVESGLTGDEELSRWFFGHFIQVYPLVFGLADQVRADGVLELLEGDEFSNDYGLMHTARSSPLSDISAGMYGPQGKGELVWALATGFLTEAEAKYGRVEKSYFFLKKIADSVDNGMPGALPELLPEGGCFMQGWSGYGIVLPVMDHYFGIRVPLDGPVLLAPHPPKELDYMEVSSVRLGSRTIDVKMENRTEVFRYELDIGEATESGSMQLSFRWTPENFSLRGSHEPISRRFEAEDHLLVEVSENSTTRIEFS